MKSSLALSLLAALTLALTAAAADTSSNSAASASAAAAHSQGPLLAWRLSPIATSASLPAKLHVPAAGGATQRPLADLLADAGLWDQRVLCNTQSEAPTVVILQQPGVHAVDLVKSKDHPIVSAIKSASSSAPAALEIPHFHMPSSATPMTALQSAASCPSSSSSSVSYIHHTLPSLASATAADAEQVADLLRQHPTALFIYSSTYALAQRVESAAAAAEPAVADFNKLPYIAQYHIFTPGLFMTLSVTIMLVAFLMVGVSWLASVKAPAGMEGSRIKSKPKTA